MKQKGFSRVEGREKEQEMGDWANKWALNIC